jgi:two-component system, chemotaxis family, chemotaxis protein CheY
MSDDIKPRVILVDDDESIRIWIKGLLVALGCEIVGEAGNGRDGVELFKKERPDLVMLDIQMPEVGGGLALEYILAADPEARVILLTSVDASGYIHELMETGAHYYLSKYAPPDEFRAALEEQISKLKQIP